MNTIFVVFQGWISVMRAGLSAVLIFYGLSFMFTSASQAAGSDESSAINAAIDRYVNDVQSAAPEAIRPPGYQNFLLTQATLTQNFVDKGKPCLAEDVLQRLRRDLARSLATNDQNDTSQLASERVRAAAPPLRPVRRRLRWQPSPRPTTTKSPSMSHSLRRGLSHYKATANSSCG